MGWVDYVMRPESSSRLFMIIVETALKTKSMFSVSVAHVKCA